MKNNEFLKKLNACYKNEQKTIKKIEKTDKKDILLKLNLELLGYSTKCINMLWLWKDLQIINREKADKEIAKRLIKNKEIYSNLLLLKK